MDKSEIFDIIILLWIGFFIGMAYGEYTVLDNLQEMNDTGNKFYLKDEHKLYEINFVEYDYSNKYNISLINITIKK